MAPKMDDETFEVYIRGKCIDCKKWSRHHPGGSKALRIFKDRDATEQFDMCEEPTNTACAVSSYFDPASAAPHSQVPLACCAQEARGHDEGRSRCAC